MTYTPASQTVVSYVKGVRGEDIIHASLAIIYQSISTGVYAGRIADCRAAKARGDEAETERIKSTLPLIFFNGKFSKRGEKGLETYSQRYCADIDDASDPAAARDLLFASPHVEYACISPTGTGVKAVYVGVSSDPAIHVQLHNAAGADIHRVLGPSGIAYKWDAVCKDMARGQYACHDTDAKFKLNVIPIEPLDLPPANPAKEQKPTIRLPSHHWTNELCSEKLYEIIAASDRQELFTRGGCVVTVFDEQNNKTAKLIDVCPHAMCSLIDHYGVTTILRSDGKGGFISGAKPATAEHARIFLKSASRALLPSIRVVVNCPIITEVDGKAAVLDYGYWPHNGGVFVTSKYTSDVPATLEEAVARILFTLEEFHFASPSDKSRAVASIITPALVLGKWFIGNRPIDFAEADKSQAGKGYRQQCIAAIYGETGIDPTVQSKGFNGDEMIHARLREGRMFVQLDNLRGHLSSELLESILTSTGEIMTRVPYGAMIPVDTSLMFFMMNSNGLTLTSDNAKRCNIIRILKRERHEYRTFPEGGIREHIAANPGRYLGAIFRIIMQWHADRKPFSPWNAVDHDFHQWARLADYMTTRYFNLPPLTDGHRALQARAHNKSASWLRQIAIQIDEDGRLNEELTASDIAAFCEEHDMPLHTGRHCDDLLKAARVVGSAMNAAFPRKQDFAPGDPPQIASVDMYQIERSQTWRKYQNTADQISQIYTFKKPIA